MLLKARKTVQITVLASLVLIIALSYSAKLYQVYGSGGGHLAGLMEGKGSYWLYKTFSRTLGLMDEPVRRADGFKGSPWSISVFGLPINDPLAALGYLTATRSVYLPLLVGMLIPLMMALVLGRVFCGWICPMNTILEAVDKARGWLWRAGPSPLGDLSPGATCKYFLLAGLFIAAAISGVSVFPYLMPQLHVGKEVFQAFYFRSFSWGIYFLGGLLLFELLLSRRGWCRHLCPAGALLSVLSLPRALRVQKLAPDCARGCDSCSAACPLGLEPQTGKTMMECSQCGLCLPRCEAGLLVFHWRGSMKLALAAGVILASLALASAAAAHHNRGLPHYGYTDNYPQNPTRERVVKHEGHYIYVTTYSFEGLRREKSDTPGDVQFYVYIKDMKTGQPYTGPVEMDIERRGEKTTYRRSGPDEEAIYKVRHSFQQRGGNCLLHIRYQGPEGEEEARVKVKLN